MPKLLISLVALLIIAVAAQSITQFFKRFHLPVISVLLFVGTLCGPFLLQMIALPDLKELNFINDLSLAFIALAAGSELYLNELRQRLKIIIWTSVFQLVSILAIGTLCILLLSSWVPFMSGLAFPIQLGIALLMAVIFVARSPSSVIAVINEMRAKGPFTQTIMGVTVLTDVLVIIAFAICLAVVRTFVAGAALDFMFLLHILINLVLSFGLGWVFGQLLHRIMRLALATKWKTPIVLLTAYGVYFLSRWLAHSSADFLHFEIELEPLLICIFGSVFVTNYSSSRSEFLLLIEQSSPYIYVLFFTYTGTTLELNYLLAVGGVAAVFFVIRSLCLFVGSFIGGVLARDKTLFNAIGWMGYVSQAGVSLGLAAIIAGEFADWGQNFATSVIALVIINQFIGPVVFKWALSIVKETHTKASTPQFDGVYDALIFGLEDLSFALARQLQSNGWAVQIIAMRPIPDSKKREDFVIHRVDRLTKEFLLKIGGNQSEAIVCLLSDEQNYEICSMAYEHLGTKDIIVRLEDRKYFDKFHQLGVKIVDPSTAMVSLLDQFVRSPIATSLLLGMESEQGIIEVEVLNRNLHGLPLRNLRLPQGIIVLSLKRRGQFIITHGFTKLRLRDFVTLVGNRADLEKVRVKFDKQ